jgi:membrane protein DedA with SNARE-associated domain
MEATILEWARTIMGSPWIYLVVFGIAMLDSFVPVVPSEALMITAGVFSATDGAPVLWPLMAAGAAGALAGDHISYGIGRWASGPVARWFEGGHRRRASMDWARTAIAHRGGLILVVARYIPGGRTATTLTMGVTHFPLRRFTPADLLAACSWAAYSSLIGYFGGHVFEDRPLYGLVLGFGVAAVITLVVEVVRRIRRRDKTP